VHSLEVQGLCKSYAGQMALRDVSFAVTAGQVMAICGENGAGKSTLMNLLSGNRQPDSGTILVDGTVVRIASPQDAFTLGIQTVYQELSLLPALSVTENLLLGRLPMRGWRIDWPEAHRRANEALARLGFGDIDVRGRVGALSVAYQQMVEIAKALSQQGSVLVLDEPTAVLTERESRALFAQIDRIRAAGGIVLYISHRLEEVIEIADRIVVLKDGELIDHMTREQATLDRVVRGMVGRELKDIYPVRPRHPGATLMRVRKLCGTRFENVSFDVREGEILGFFGLVGSGRTDLMRALFGADRRGRGEVLLHDVPFAPKDPGAAIAAGLAMVTEERKHDGLLLDCDVLDNGSLASLKRFTRGGVLDNRSRRRTVADKVAQMSIRPSGLARKLRAFSGGNQQKVVLAKWLLVPGLKLLILDEPTRGVDVGTKSEIYRLIAELAASGVAILLVSSELPEILGLSDRIGVMREGSLVTCIERQRSTEQQIFGLAAGLANDPPTTLST